MMVLIGKESMIVKKIEEMRDQMRKSGAKSIKIRLTKPTAEDVLTELFGIKFDINQFVSPNTIEFEIRDSFNISKMRGE